MSADPRKLAMDCKRICLGFEMLASRAMASEGLSVSQAMILMFVLRNSEKGTSLTAIHRQFGYSMASLSSTIKRLKSNGYIRVEPCPSDDRLKLLFGHVLGGDLLGLYLQDDLLAGSRYRQRVRFGGRGVG